MIRKTRCDKKPDWLKRLQDNRRNRRYGRKNREARNAVARAYRETHPDRRYVRGSGIDPNIQREQRQERYFRFERHFRLNGHVDEKRMSRFFKNTPPAVVNQLDLVSPRFFYIDANGCRKLEVWETSDQLVDRLRREKQIQ
jgi:hypothetical protein